MLLEVAGVRPSTYHFWRKRFEDPSYNDEDPRLAIVAAAFDQARGLYGHRRVRLVLRDQGHYFSRKTVNKLLNTAGRRCKLRRKRYVNGKRGNAFKTCANIVDRQFSRDKPNKLWFTDLTVFHVGGKHVYLSAIKDAFNGEIVAHDISTVPNVNLVERSFNAAFKRNLVGPDLIVHSDQGLQYTNRRFVEYLEKAGITQSMSRKGNCLDNAPIESFFGHMKDDIGRRHFNNLDEFTQTIEEYIYFYNYQRIQERLGGMSPIQYRHHHTTQTQVP